MKLSELPLEERGPGVAFDLRAAPGASRARVVGLHGSALKVAVTAAAEKGKANAAIIKLLAQALGCAQSDFEVLRGHSSRDKRLLCRSLGAEDFRARLALLEG